MPKVDVNKLMNAYAAQRGISKNEMVDLQKKVGFKPTAEQLKAIKKAEVAHRDEFEPAAKVELDRFIGLFEIKGGKTVEKYSQFNDLWKIDKDAGFRAKWGVTDKNDPRAPSFEARVPAAKVPAAIREKFLNFAKHVLVDGGQIDEKRVTLGFCTRVYDLNHKPIGYALSVNEGSHLTGYYKNDGTPAGLSADAPND